MCEGVGWKSGGEPPHSKGAAVEALTNILTLEGVS